MTTSAARPIHVAICDRQAATSPGDERPRAHTPSAISKTSAPTMFANTSGTKLTIHAQRPRRRIESSRSRRSVIHGITAP
jgi:hypothetical protein